MNRSQALKEAVRLFGKNAAVRDLGRKFATNEQERRAASAEYRRLVDSLGTEGKKQRRKELDDLFARSVRYQFTVGAISTLGPFRAFSVRGQGDTWEEAFAKVDACYKKAA